MWNFLVVVIASSCTFCQELPVNYSYSVTVVASTEVRICAATYNIIESIRQDVHSFINNSVLPALKAGPGYRACGCGGAGWRRAAYLNMSDPTLTCPPAWELITTPRRSCAKPSSTSNETCYSAMFPALDIQYSQVCGRIIGYQLGAPQAFRCFNDGFPRTIDSPYVDGVSLTYGSPRQHIWTFAGAIDVTSRNPTSRCTCTYPSRPNPSPSFVGDDYFCETGVPPGQGWSHNTFHADDPLWDGQGCGPISTCCTFNSPPWFCKQLSQSTSASLEFRLCSTISNHYQTTPIELIEIYVK